MTRRLVLLGGGHAHLFVLEGLARRPVPGLETVLISLDQRQAYSGMIPGMIEGRYRPAELSFHLPAICRSARAAFILAEAARLVPAERRVMLTGGEAIEYDLLSVATGSVVEAGDMPGVVRHAHRVKPVSRALEIVPALERATAEAADPGVVVVGAGAAGVEVALAVRARLRTLGRSGAAVTIIDSERRLLGGRMPAAERRVTRALARNRVTARLGSRVSNLLPDRVRLDDGSELPAKVVIWATGAAAPALLRDSGLPVDGRGFLLVTDRLQSLGDPSVFAAGDAATLERHPGTPKAGVYAVRQGPVLWRNLSAAVGGAPPPARYRSQARFLAILNTGDGRAVLAYGGLAAWSSWAMTLKDRIDRRFMRRFQALESG
jgi:selenide,water dikinase